MSPADFTPALAQDPRYQLFAGPGRWLCPHCVHLVPVATERADVARRSEHLAQDCPAATQPAHPLDRLERALARHIILERLVHDPAWRIATDRGSWCCPYCAQPTDIPLPRSRQEIPTAIKPIQAHLRDCPDYAPGQAPHSPHSIFRAVEGLSKAGSLTAQIRREMELHPCFQLQADGRWFCPYCASLVPHIDISTPVLREHTAPGQIGAHLRHGCPGARRSPRITRPIEELQLILAQARVASAKNFPTPEPSKTVVRELRGEISRLLSELKATSELSASLARAQDIQERMLPRLPELPEYAFGAHYTPCARVSGDFYEIIRVEGARYHIAVGDVSGHGIEAALVMGMTKKAFALHARTGLGPAETLQAVNADIFPELAPTTFVTMACGLLDTETHHFATARAGHPYVYRRRADGSLRRFQSGGLMVGVVQGAAFDGHIAEEEVVLEPGETVLLYTDGVLEAVSAREETFGTAGLEEFLRRSGDRPPAGLVDALARAVAHHIDPAPPQDDVTILAFQRRT